MRLLFLLLLVGCAAADPPYVRVPHCVFCERGNVIADVKTCGCPKKATCGDCCGPEHCRCNPN